VYGADFFGEIQTKKQRERKGPCVITAQVGCPRGLLLERTGVRESNAARRKGNTQCRRLPHVQRYQSRKIIEEDSRGPACCEREASCGPVQECEKTCSAPNCSTKGCEKWGGDSIEEETVPKLQKKNLLYRHAVREKSEERCYPS